MMENIAYVIILLFTSPSKVLLGYIRNLSHLGTVPRPTFFLRTRFTVWLSLSSDDLVKKNNQNFMEKLREIGYRENP